jgi:hypothetical protein
MNHVGQGQLLPVPVGLARYQVPTDLAQHQGALTGIQSARAGGDWHLAQADRAAADG